MASVPARKVPPARDCFLGVERSLGGRRWEARLGDPRAGLAIAQRFELPEVVGRAIAARGVALDQSADFLAPRLRAHLPDPSGFRDMDRAVARLIAALEAEETVAVFGDYDVDGATSAALLHRFLAALGRPPLLYIPDRMTEGYGPNETAFRKLQARGASLVVTVDCGTTAYEPLAQAVDAGLDVIVLDHHTAEAELPEAAALVNPNRRDESGQCRQLAAVGVSYLLLIALNRALRERGWYETAGRRAPELLDFLDLVALGTVCDVVPLTELNRAFVAQGLKVMARRANRGLAALAEVARLDRPPGTYHAGFLLGPRINAGGRVGESALGVRLLTTEDPAEAADLARRLDALNQERREIEQAVLDQALAQVAEAPANGLTFAAGEGWHPGVIGIVASRLKERTNLPSLVVALEDGIGKGSARSVPGVDLGRAVLDAKAAGLLINGGGHPMAAGLTVAAERLDALRDFLDQALAREMAEIAYRPVLGLDGALQPRAATFELVDQMERLAPFGVGNPEPRFALTAVRVARPQGVGDGHLRCRLVGADGAAVKAIAFRAFDGPLGQALSTAGGLPFHVAGKLRPDTWPGRRRCK